MSKQAVILRVIILLFLVLTVFLFRTTRIFMIGLVLLFSARKLIQLVTQFREDQKIERMGDYVTAYKLAKAWGYPEETIADWCEQGRVPSAFKNANLWLIPRDITIVEINKAHSRITAVIRANLVPSIRLPAIQESINRGAGSAILFLYAAGNGKQLQRAR
jgi:hypothetical protein